MRPFFLKIDKYVGGFCVMLLDIDFNIFVFQVASQMARYLIRQENTVYRFLSKLVMERLLKVTHSIIIIFNNYRPPKKLQEGNVFSRVCPSVSLSTGGGGSHVTIARDALDLIIQSPPPPGPTPSTETP